jgi:ATP-binding cassette subfamily B protein
MGKDDAETRGSSAGVRAGLHPRGSRGLEKIERAKEPKSALVGLMAYLVPFRAAIVVVLALVAASTVLSLLGPYLMGVAIDRFIALKKTEGLARIALLMLAAYLMTNFCQAAASWIMARVSQDALRRIRGELFQHLQALPLRFFDGNSTGELMSRLTNDIDAINQAVSQNVVSFVASILSMAGILVAMFVLDRWLALASVLVVPVMFGFTRFIARHTRKRFQDLQKQLGELNAVAEESISGGKLVKAFGRKDSTFEAFASANAEVWRAGISANTYALLLMPLTNVLGNFFVIVLASLGGWLALKGLVTAGIIATFINYGQNFIQPLRQVANLYNTIQAALAGAERVFAVLGTSPEIDEGAGSAPVDSIRGDVRFENVTFGYEKGRPIIRNMSFEANSGETIALVGPTGAGKTTLINLLMRFYETDSGRILLDGRDIREIGKADLRRHLGLVLQDTFLFQASVMENIRFGRLDAGDSEVIEAAKVTGADFFIRQLPRGYRTILSESGSNLSQGQRQLLSISRAVLADPGILILDEATSNVDTRTELQLQKALGDLLEGRTSFVIAHRLSTIREADQVLVVDNGEIVEKGTHKELLARKGIYHRLYLSQFKGLEI